MLCEHYNVDIKSSNWLLYWLRTFLLENSCRKTFFHLLPVNLSNSDTFYLISNEAVVSQWERNYDVIIIVYLICEQFGNIKYVDTQGFTQISFSNVTFNTIVHLDNIFFLINPPLSRKYTHFYLIMFNIFRNVFYFLLWTSYQLFK